MRETLCRFKVKIHEILQVLIQIFPNRLFKNQKIAKWSNGQSILFLTNSFKKLKFGWYVWLFEIDGMLLIIRKANNYHLLQTKYVFFGITISISRKSKAKLLFKIVFKTFYCYVGSVYCSEIKLVWTPIFSNSP
jgi:hypothetical protein